MDYTIKLVQKSPTVDDLIPDYQYQFTEVPPSNESNSMFLSLVDFIRTNSELAVSNITNKEEYAKGFKQSLAITRLWMDSMYLGGEAVEPTNGTSTGKNTN